MTHIIAKLFSAIFILNLTCILLSCNIVKKGITVKIRKRLDLVTTES
jgi:hypothetical protein